jgi:chemotaxis protein histidine kinase CheA
VKPATRQELVAVVLHENGESASTVAPAAIDPVLRDLIPEFLERKVAELDALRDAVQSGDSEAVRRGAHRLRGTFGLYGFDEAATMCATLEELARDRPHAVREGAVQVRALYTYVQRIRGDTQ